MKDQNILHRFVGAIPILGPGLAIFVEHVEAGITQYGILLGSIRGIVVGLILCAALIVVSEAVLIGLNTLRDYLEVNSMAGVRVTIRKHAMEDGNQQYVDKYVQREKEVEANQPQPAKPLFTDEGGR
jgi:hypothetical protein